MDKIKSSPIYFFLFKKPFPLDIYMTTGKKTPSLRLTTSQLKQRSFAYINVLRVEIVD